MRILGLTGSIGMGKTTLCSQLASMGAKYINADHIVHALLAKGGAAVAEVGEAFPGVVKDGAVVRSALRPLVFNNPENRRKLESILHPKVVAVEEGFVQKMRALGAHWVVLDIPLLFETGAQQRCDYTLLATAPYAVQRARVMRRPGMNEQLFQQVLAAQMPDQQKRRLADFIIPTGLGKAYSYAALRECLALIEGDTA